MATLKINNPFSFDEIMEDADLTNIRDVAEKIYQKQYRLLRWIDCNPFAFRKVDMQEWVDKNSLYPMVKKTLKNNLSEVVILADKQCAYTNWHYNPRTGDVIDGDFETKVFGKSLAGYVQLGVVSSFFAFVDDNLMTQLP